MTKIMPPVQYIRKASITSFYIFKDMNSSTGTPLATANAPTDYDDPVDGTRAVMAKVSMKNADKLPPRFLDVCVVAMNVAIISYCLNDDSGSFLLLLSVNKMFASIIKEGLRKEVEKILNLSFKRIRSMVRCVDGNTANNRFNERWYISSLRTHYKATINGMKFDVGISLSKDADLENVKTVGEVFDALEHGLTSQAMEWATRVCLSGNGDLSIWRAFGVFASERNRKAMINYILRFRIFQSAGGEFHNERSNAIINLLMNSYHFSDLTTVAQYPADFYVEQMHPEKIERLCGFHMDVNPADITFLNETLDGNNKLSLGSL